MAVSFEMADTGLMSETAEHPTLRWLRGWRIVLIACALIVALFVAYLAWWFLPLFFGNSAPKRSHWTEQVAQFEAVVAELKTPEGQAKYNDPVYMHNIEIAGMPITGIREQGDNVLFYDETGCGILDDAGYAYMPNGIDPTLENGSFEGPQYRSLGGAWYSFCASW